MFSCSDSGERGNYNCGLVDEIRASFPLIPLSKSVAIHIREFYNESAYHHLYTEDGYGCETHVFVRMGTVWRG
jgi:hypothetical protein